MIKKTYALLDHTAGTFLNSLTFINDGDAIRWFGTIVNGEEKTNISMHPEQFTLFRLADFDDVTGTYQGRDKELTETRDRANGTETVLTMSPKQIITGVEVQIEQTKKFTVKDLVSMLKQELNITNEE